jgi:hypothetical protein
MAARSLNLSLYSFSDLVVERSRLPCPGFGVIWLHWGPRLSQAEKRFLDWLEANAPGDAASRLLDRRESTNRHGPAPSRRPGKQRRQLVTPLVLPSFASLARDFLTRLKSVRSPLRALDINEVGALA